MLRKILGKFIFLFFLLLLYQKLRKKKRLGSKDLVRTLEVIIPCVCESCGDRTITPTNEKGDKTLLNYH